MSNKLKLKVRTFYGKAPSVMKVIIGNLIEGGEDICTYLRFPNQNISPNSV